MSRESKITTKDGTTIKITGGGKKDNVSVSIYSGDYKDKDKDKHTGIHVNVNTKTDKVVLWNMEPITQTLLKLTQNVI